jgi:hypothetical protein
MQAHPSRKKRDLYLQALVLRVKKGGEGTSPRPSPMEREVLTDLRD